jgi:hypothetical protein
MILLVAALLIAGSAFGQAMEVGVFYLDSLGEYNDTPEQSGQADALARCFTTNEMDGYCNQATWDIPVVIHASVAQWIDWSMTGTNWNWFVRKPGWYAANSITAQVASNGDVLIDYQGFENLVSVEGNNHDNEIEIWYSYGPTISEAVQNGWRTAEALNEDDDLLDESELVEAPNDLHEGIGWKLWNRIYVSNCNTACEYEDEAMIVLTADQQKPWIDPETGFFVESPLSTR